MYIMSIYNAYGIKCNISPNSALCSSANASIFFQEFYAARASSSLQIKKVALGELLYKFHVYIMNYFCIKAYTVFQKTSPKL